MTRFVLDASVALAWFVDHPVAAYAVRVRKSLARDAQAVVPGLWHLEMANGLAVAERRGILTSANSTAGITHPRRAPGSSHRMQCRSHSLAASASALPAPLSFRHTTRFTSTPPAASVCLLPLWTDVCFPPLNRLEWTPFPEPTSCIDSRPTPAWAATPAKRPRTG